MDKNKHFWQKVVKYLLYINNSITKLNVKYIISTIVFLLCYKYGILGLIDSPGLGLLASIGIKPELFENYINERFMKCQND